MHRFKLGLFAAAFALAGVTVTSQGQAGWTNLALPAGAQAFYVAATGNDSNPGTQAAPFQSIQRGYNALRDGQADQLLLRCGDTWTLSSFFGTNKGCSTPGQYMVIGSYGTGPRPKVVTLDAGFRGESTGRRGLAFVGLEVAGLNPAVTNSGIIMLGWRDLLIEDCYVHGYGYPVVVQGFDTRSSGIRVRRNVIADAFYAPTNFNGNGDPIDRAVGFYMDLTDDWIIEENVFDRCGITGSVWGRPMYIQSDCGRGIFRDNIMSRSCAEGVQVRCGGVVTNNLALRCPIGIYVGNSQPGVNDVQYNVVIESGDINLTDRRGRGIHINGSSVIKNNVLGYNTGTGWGATFGIFLDYGDGECSNNYIYDWTRDPALGGPGPSAEGQAIEISGASAWTLSDNKVYQIRPGIVMEPNQAWISGNNNMFWWGGGLPAFRPAASFGGWASLASAPANPGFKIPDLTGMSFEAWIAEARKQSKQYWRSEYTTTSFNALVRARVGGAPPPPPTPCYANCDGSTGTPRLTANDFMCYFNKFVQGDSYANCDGSSGTPTLTANDFSCFMSRYATGCP